MKKRWLRRLFRNWSVRFGLILLIVMTSATVGAGFLSSYSPDYSSLRDRNSPPMTADYILGTNDLGQDVWTRVIYGGRNSLWIGSLSVAIALFFGTLLGLSAGYAGKWVDGLIMRCIDIILAFPTIVLASAIVAVMGRSMVNVMIAVGIVGIPRFARQIRASVLQLRDNDYVYASRALGASPLRIVSIVILPNCLAPIIVLATLGFATALLEVAGLGFIGLGGEPGLCEWGADLNLNRTGFTVAPWAVTVPGLAIALSVLAFNLLGDGLRDSLDVRLAK